MEEAEEKNQFTGCGAVPKSYYLKKFYLFQTRSVRQVTPRLNCWEFALIASLSAEFCCAYNNVYCI